ncbi:MULTISPECIES: hypothetical protein [Paraburkholderia]|uniref:hypothetical protein n=1 Tax=Paraburkholderia TaxID=1822464 RepID=UPI0038BD7D74
MAAVSSNEVVMVDSKWGFSANQRVVAQDVEVLPVKLYGGRISSVWSDGSAIVIWDQDFTIEADKHLVQSGRVDLHYLTRVVAGVSQAEAYSKSRELLDLVYSHGFTQAKTAYTYDMFLTDLRNEFPDAVRANGRIAGTNEQVYWMSDSQIVAIWNPEASVGATGYTNVVRAVPAHH